MDARVKVQVLCARVHVRLCMCLARAAETLTARVSEAHHSAAAVYRPCQPAVQLRGLRTHTLLLARARKDARWACWYVCVGAP